MPLDRRVFLASLATTAASASAAAAQARGPAQPVPDEAYFDGLVDDNGFSFRKTNMKQIAALYVTFENNTALRYGVGVGREGFQWFGRAEVGRKAVWPDWVPPAEMLARRPDLPKQMKGGPDNPLGPRAHYLYRDGRDLIYRIHGTTEPWSIGTDVSSGCIRMLNEDVIDLYQRTPVGTRVLVLKHLSRDRRSI